jgi:demethylmenaquinone methyltransferase/2-methoxy-6-polyprenyl-1,4-benzoquinol methylase
MNKKPVIPGRRVLPVSRSSEDARQFYDSISEIYDSLSGPHERKYTEAALKRLYVREGDNVLEIGFGTGHSLKKLAESTGNAGRVYGIDISPRMLRIARKRIEKAGLAERIALYCGDALSLPYKDSFFDAVFMSFTLELFDTPEIPQLLQEVKRVLKPGGKTGVVSMSAENGRSLLLKIYEFAHKTWPKYVDCRPIYTGQSLTDAGFEIINKEIVKLFSLPIEIVIAKKKNTRS